MIRPATRADLEAVLAIERACFPDDALPLISFVQYFDLFAETFAVAASGDAVEGGAVDGFAIAGASAARAERAWILDVAVAPHARGRGVARELLAFVLRELAARGAKSVEATIAPRNVASRELFARAGFRVDREVPDYFGPGQARQVVRLDIR